MEEVTIDTAATASEFLLDPDAFDEQQRLLELVGQQDEEEEFDFIEEDDREETFPAAQAVQLSREAFEEPTLPSMDTEGDTEETEELSGTPSPMKTTIARASATIDERGKSPSFATPVSDPPSSNSSEESPMQHHQKRFLQLQSFLKLCDEADQKELLEALRSLSAAARSGHAFNLEYRALMLSMEEGREMLRLKMLNVMGGKATSTPPQQTSPTPSSQETPVGSRLPAPGLDH